MKSPICFAALALGMLVSTPDQAQAAPPKPVLSARELLQVATHVEHLTNQNADVSLPGGRLANGRDNARGHIYVLFKVAPKISKSVRSYVNAQGTKVVFLNGRANPAESRD